LLESIEILGANSLILSITGITLCNSSSTETFEEFGLVDSPPTIYNSAP